MVFDKKGTRHIAFQDSKGTLKYAFESGQNWGLVSLDTDDEVGSNLSLALDKEDNFHISYLDLKWTRLKYATNSSGNTAITVIEQGLVGWFTSLAIDKSGRIHVAYRDTKHGTTRYATCTKNCQLTSAWSLEDVDDEGDAGKFASITVDDEGTPYVAYTVIDQNEFRVAHKKDGIWKIETVVAGGPAGWCTSVTVGPKGNFYMSYMDKVDGMLRFGSRVDGLWRTEPIASAPIGKYVGQKSSIALDNFGRVHVAWSDDSGLGVRYAWCPVLCDGLCCNAWGHMVLDSEVPIGSGVSLALDKLDRPHVAYVTGKGLEASLKIVSAKCSETPIDANCDGTDGIDADGDGYASIGSGGTDCNDSNASINPGVIDKPNDSTDSNCDGKDN
jgi:hypothetical protein